MEKIIVYTCIVGGYDTLQQPLVTAEDFEFICFVGRGEKQADRIGVWHVEEIPYGWNDDALLARSQKLNPQAVLPEDSEWSVWIDGNLQVVEDSFYQQCRELKAKGCSYVGIKHPSCDNAYKEALRCMREGKDRFSRLLKTVVFLRRAGVKKHDGLQDTSVIFRKHNDPAVVEFDRWWWECLVHNSVRDCLTQGFALADTPALKADLVDGFYGLRRVNEHKRPQGFLNLAGAVLLWIFIVKSCLIPKAERISFEKD